MKTLAKSWAERLAELVDICRHSGGLPVDLRIDYYREHRRQWWADFCYAADAGDDLSAAVWRAAKKIATELSSNGGGEIGWYNRLVVRNRSAREFLLKSGKLPV
jgi:hypothetical protein